MVPIEVRPYGPDSTEEEREAILSRVSVAEERIVHYRELPVQSPYSIDLLMSKMRELGTRWDKFAEVLDLRECRRPDALTRERIMAQIRTMKGQLVHVAAIVGSNAVIRAVARLVAFAMGVELSLHTKESDALEAARRAIA